MVSRDVIEDVISGWREDIAKETVIERDLLPSLLESLSMEEVTVLTGVRRSGKTFMMYALQRQRGGVYINFEDERLTGFQLEDFEKLMDITEAGGTNILYLDEVQEAPGWEKFAHRAHRKMKLVVSGSNSSLLSADFSKALVGRTKTFVSRPLDYVEYLGFKGAAPGRATFLEFMKMGGFPRVVLTGDLALAREYLDRIVYRDITAKNDIRNPKAIMDLAMYLLSNVGKQFSYRSLKDVTGLKHDATVKQYMDYLEGAFLIKTIKRYSGSMKVQETYPKKVYAVDPAFIGLGKRLDDDRGLVLENIIFNHLATKWDVYFAKNGADVDFLLCKGTRQVEAVNVTFEVSGKDALDRELKGLLRMAEQLGIKARLVSVYPVSGLPDEVEGNLVYRYLAR